MREIHKLFLVGLSSVVIFTNMWISFFYVTDVVEASVRPTWLGTVFVVTYVTVSVAVLIMHMFACMSGFLKIGPGDG